MYVDEFDVDEAVGDSGEYDRVVWLVVGIDEIFMNSSIKRKTSHSIISF
jgi:hypothetical protein